MLEIFADDYELDWMAKFSNEEMRHNELQIFSFTHDVVGGELLKKWLFPEKLITAVAYHHRPVEATEEKGSACIIQLADFLSFYCSNMELFKGDDILTAIDKTFPDIRSQWQYSGLPMENNDISGWFNWLSNNYEQGCNLKDAFSC